MRVLAAADLHGHLPEIPDCDVLIVAGDVCPDMPDKVSKYDDLDRSGVMQAGWLGQTFAPWLGALAERGIKVFGIAGNHDFVFERIPDSARMLNWTYLRDEGVEYEGIKFWGTPWVPGLSRWAFYGNDEALLARAGSIPPDTDILISHGPPYGTLDFTVPKFGSVHVGDAWLTRWIKDNRPPVVVCGHIHEGYGKDLLGESVVYNVAHTDENYSDEYRPIQLVWASS